MTLGQLRIGLNGHFVAKYRSSTNFEATNKENEGIRESGETKRVRDERSRDAHDRRCLILVTESIAVIGNRKQRRGFLVMLVVFIGIEGRVRYIQRV